ncbi:MAG TPA: hypothetical protein VNQ99_05025 [Xanthobacteraceae bacterium]|nr:hypothetical protein [Xanthobacteraceae bacterium]
MIKHRCADHRVAINTEILIIGTFNPEVPENEADFFYGRGRNGLWTFLAESFGVEDLKTRSKEQKMDFIRGHRIDFIDLIAEIDKAPTNYEDRFLDQHVIKWNDVIGTIAGLKSLKKACVSRKGFSDVPKIKKRVEEIESHLNERQITFRRLHTPGRAHKRGKPEWLDFFRNS